MAANQLRIDGLAELRKALQQLPPELVREAQVIVQAQAEAAAYAMAAAYPAKSGALRAGLQVEIAVDQVSATARVRNTLFKKRFTAHVFEKGSPPRQWKNGKSTGAMPAGKVFVPIAIFRRRMMVAALVDLITRAGLTVTSSA